MVTTKEREEYNKVMEELKKSEEIEQANYYKEMAKNIYPYIREMLFNEIRRG